MKKYITRIAIVVLLSVSIIFALSNKVKKADASDFKIIKKEIAEEIAEEKVEKQPTSPKTPNISVKTPEFLSYNQTVSQLKKWHEEAPDLTEIGTYGLSAAGKDLYYIKLTNTYKKEKKPAILVHSCIHGNEVHAASNMMAYFGNMLSQYGSNPEITDILDNKEIYFIPVISPDSYPNYRMNEKVDPNRDFPTPQNPEHQSSKIIMALREFFWKIKPKSVLSAHTFGRLYMIPYGDSYEKCPHQEDYQRIVGKMAELSNYKMIHTSKLYSKPISGTEVDWYYRNGAFAMVAEFGTHQKKPTTKEIQSEYERTKSAITLFLKESTDVKFTAANEDLDFSRNTGIAQTYLRLPNGDLAPTSQQ